MKEGQEGAVAFYLRLWFIAEQTCDRLLLFLLLALPLCFTEEV